LAWTLRFLLHIRELRSRIFIKPDIRSRMEKIFLPSRIRGSPPNGGGERWSRSQRAIPPTPAMLQTLCLTSPAIANRERACKIGNKLSIRIDHNHQAHENKRFRRKMPKT
jgi:hypothetical protein